MAHSKTALQDAVRDAAARLQDATRSSPYRLFEELDPSEAAGSGNARHAVGFIEGAALALGLTPIELLDECGVSAPD